MPGLHQVMLRSQTSSSVLALLELSHNGLVMKMISYTRNAHTHNLCLHHYHHFWKKKKTPVETFLLLDEVILHWFFPVFERQPSKWTLYVEEPTFCFSQKATDCSWPKASRSPSTLDWSTSGWRLRTFRWVVEEVWRSWLTTQPFFCTGCPRLCPLLELCFLSIVRDPT